MSYVKLLFITEIVLYLLLIIIDILNDIFINK